MTRIRRIAPFAPYNPALLPPQARMSASVCASIVVYESDPALLARTLRSLDEALANLAALDSRKSQVVELRYFGGLTAEETAGFLNLSLRTVEREWNMAKAWLYRALSEKQPDEG